MELAMIGSALLEKLLPKRFLIGIAGLLVFAVMISVFLSALLLTGLYAVFRLMVEHGMTADMALLATSSMGVMLILILAALAIRHFRRLQRALNPRPALASHIGQATEDFINGLLTPSAPKHD